MASARSPDATSATPPLTSRGRAAPVLLAALLLTTLAACETQAPTFNATVPDPVFPRQIVAVDGADLSLGNVRWDAGQPSETGVEQALFSARFFQVPQSASAGGHPVLIRNDEGNSATRSVQVQTLDGSWPAPRITDVTFRLFNAGTSDASAWLMVTAANGDAEATVSVDGTDEDAVLYSALPSDHFNAHDASTFRYPIYHYAQYIVPVDGLSLGSSVGVTVTNTGGQTSGTYSLSVPASEADLDSDGDGLKDDWEENGYDADGNGTVDVDLPAMGADPHRKDVFVEVDWVAAAQPNGGIWADIEDVFDAAPVMNPDGSTGITIHIDRGQGGAFTDGGDTLTPTHSVMDFGPAPSGVSNYVNFYTYKNNFFDGDRLDVFHYAVFGVARPFNSSGRGEILGNDFMVTFATFSVWPQDIAQVGTFVHELGHNLDLRHGAPTGRPTPNTTFQPNQPSTMNYRYQFGGVSEDCDWTSENLHTFAVGMYEQLDESDVDESQGICDGASLDMNGDGTISTSGALNLNRGGCSPCSDSSCDCDTTDTHQDWPEWHEMEPGFQGDPDASD